MDNDIYDKIEKQLTQLPGMREPVYLHGTLATPAERGILAGVRAALRAEDTEGPPIDAAPVVARMLAKIRAAEIERCPSRHGVNFRPSWLRYGVLATVFSVGMLMLGWYGLEARAPRILSTQTFVYTAANGQRATITLPDGSTAVLNVGSRLEIPANYLEGYRSVKLSGEALFSVRPDAASPFLVTAGPSTTRVLGTDFLVRFYPTDTTALVTVRNGKVVVGTTILTAAQQIAVRTDGLGSVRTIDLAEFPFESETLVLKHMRLRDAIPELNRWYDADIRLADPALGGKLIEGEFVQGSLRDLIEQFEWSLDVNIVREGKTLTLSRR